MGSAVISGSVDDKEVYCVLSDGMCVCGRWRGSIVCEFRRVHSKYLDSNDSPLPATL